MRGKEANYYFRIIWKKVFISQTCLYFGVSYIETEKEEQETFLNHSFTFHDFFYENSTFILRLQTEIFIVSSIGALIKLPGCHCDETLNRKHLR